MHVTQRHGPSLCKILALMTSITTDTDLTALSFGHLESNDTLQLLDHRNF